MRLRGVIDCLIPRGGPSLIEAIVEHATVPYVIDGDGNCHVYVDRAADLDMALAIVVNGKTQRPSVCNATESLVVHRDVADRFLAGWRRRSRGSSCGATRRPGGVGPGPGGRRHRRGLRAGVPRPHPERQGGRRPRRGHRPHPALRDGPHRGHRHRDLVAAQRFQREVDAAAVVVNASTRFTDGEEFGFGAEIGISTQKLHARGPMGLRELTTTKYLVSGSGQIRARPSRVTRPRRATRSRRSGAGGERSKGRYASFSPRRSPSRPRGWRRGGHCLMSRPPRGQPLSSPTLPASTPRRWWSLCTPHRPERPRVRPVGLGPGRPVPNRWPAYRSRSSPILRPGQ
jgi:hypothetical protein